MMTSGVLFWLAMSRSETGEVMICFLARAIVVSGLSSVNLMREVICPLTKTLSKIVQGRIGDMSLGFTELYLGILLRVWLKSISMTVINLLSDSRIAVA